MHIHHEKISWSPGKTKVFQKYPVLPPRENLVVSWIKCVCLLAPSPPPTRKSRGLVDQVGMPASTSPPTRKSRGLVAQVSMPPSILPPRENIVVSSIKWVCLLAPHLPPGPPVNLVVKKNYHEKISWFCGEILN